MTKSVTVEVWFDFICPWCLIGKRQLEAAVEAFAREAPGAEVAVAWRPYVLLPQTPPEGEPYLPFYENRLGGRAAVAARQTQVRDAGHAAGVSFAFERIQRLPNTFDAHGLVDYARRTAGEAAAATVIDQLLTAYFREGADIGDEAFLMWAAHAAGLDPHGWRDERDLHLTLARIGDWGRAAQRAQVVGVPFYLFDGRTALAGAQSPAALLGALRRSAGK